MTGWERRYCCTFKGKEEPRPSGSTSLPLLRRGSATRRSAADPLTSSHLLALPLSSARRALALSPSDTFSAFSVREKRRNEKIQGEALNPNITKLPANNFSCDGRERFLPFASKCCCFFFFMFQKNSAPSALRNRGSGRGGIRLVWILRMKY